MARRVPRIRHVQTKDERVGPASRALLTPLNQSCVLTASLIGSLIGTADCRKIAAVFGLRSPDIILSYMYTCTHVQVLI